MCHMRVGIFSHACKIEFVQASEIAVKPFKTLPATGAEFYCLHVKCSDSVAHSGSQSFVKNMTRICYKPSVQEDQSTTYHSSNVIITLLREEITFHPTCRGILAFRILRQLSHKAGRNALLASS